MTESRKKGGRANHNTAPETQVQIPLAELIKIRRDKIKELAQKGINTYPYRYERNCFIQSALDRFEELAEQTAVLRFAGRIIQKRKMGKVFFADIRDASGRIQVYVKIDNVGKGQFDLASNSLLRLLSQFIHLHNAFSDCPLNAFQVTI